MGIPLSGYLESKIRCSIVEEKLSKIHFEIDHGNFQKAEDLAEVLQQEIGDSYELNEIFSLIDRFLIVKAGA